MIRPTVKKVSERGPGAKALEDALKRAAKMHATVGVHSDAGTYANKNVTPGQTALWNEFGTRRMPARPFMGPALDENRGVVARGQQQAVANIMAGWAPEKALLKLGLLIQLLIQNKIKSNVGPALSGVYKGDKARGYLGRKYLMRQPARTLIATGLMLRSVRAYVMDEKGDRVALSPQTNPDFGAPELSAEDMAQARASARADGRARKLANAARRAIKSDRNRLIGDFGD